MCSLQIWSTDSSILCATLSYRRSLTWRRLVVVAVRCWWWASALSDASARHFSPSKWWAKSRGRQSLYRKSKFFQIWILTPGEDHGHDHDSQYYIYKKTCAFIAKFGISGTFGLVYVYTGELYPTPIRGFKIEFFSVCCKSKTNSLIIGTVSTLISEYEIWKSRQTECIKFSACFL